MLEELVKRAAEELRLKERAIDEVMGRARRARVLSKQAILQIHGGSVEEAGERLHEAGRNLHEMDEYVRERPTLGRFDQVNAAREEYAEASILLRLEGSGKFPSPEAVGVPLEAYLKGLGDVPGELRRQALDALRVGDLERAEVEARKSLELHVEIHGGKSRYAAEPMTLLARILVKKGRYTEAEPVLRHALEIREQQLPPRNWETAKTRSVLGAALAGLGRFEEAEPLVLAGYEIITKDRGPQHRRTSCRRKDI